MSLTVHGRHQSGEGINWNPLENPRMELRACPGTQSLLLPGSPGVASHILNKCGSDIVCIAMRRPQRGDSGGGARAAAAGGGQAGRGVGVLGRCIGRPRRGGLRGGGRSAADPAADTLAARAKAYCQWGQSHPVVHLRSVVAS